MFERVLGRQLMREGKRSVLVLGPRQVGKTTLLASLKPDLALNLASPAAFRDYATHPERLEHELRGAAPNVRTVLIDEVQRVPALLDLVQVFLDEHPRRFRFLLSGSSARKLKRGQANLLPGRVHVHYLYPLLACELGQQFDVDRVLAHGTLPGIYSEPDTATRESDLRSDADTYLREEVHAEALVRNIGGYGRLLELVAASSGKILNLNSLCGDAGLSYETARRYVDVLEDTLVVFRVPAWSGADRKSLVSHPKLFLFDLGVRNALLRRPLDRPLDDERGFLLEHLIAYEIQRRLGSSLPRAVLYYYRTRHGSEVDFLLEVDRELWAIEVKAGRRIDRRALKGFESLSERAQRLKRRIVVFLGPRKQRIEDAEILPLHTFLDELPR
jgi:predicted AAA+ superfamily ATPase